MNGSPLMPALPADVLAKPRTISCATSHAVEWVERAATARRCRYATDAMMNCTLAPAMKSGFSSRIAFRITKGLLNSIGPKALIERARRGSSNRPAPSAALVASKARHRLVLTVVDVSPACPAHAAIVTTNRRAQGQGKRGTFRRMK